MDTRELSEKYAEIAHKLIQEEPELEYLKGAPISIAYLASSHAKKKSGALVYGQCEKVQEKYKWGIPADFTITVFEPNVVEFTEEKLKILIFHELLHIGKDYDSINPHDLEDFRYIIDRFGAYWDQA